MSARILAVDDNPTNLTIIEETLSGSYDLHLALDGEACLEAARDLRPDIVLLDIMMPGIDGYETCRRLRAMPELARTKVILVSAKAMVSERLRGFEAGADDYLCKPFDEDELRAKLRVFLRLKTIEEVDQLKTNLLKLLNHEVRTPVNGLVNAAEMIAEGGLDPKELASMGGVVRDSARRLVEFLERAMLLGQLMSRNAQFEFEPVDLGLLVREATARVQEAATGRSVGIDVRMAEAPEVEVDRCLMTGAIQSVLENAVHHTPPGEAVLVTFEGSREGVRLSITDRGSGVEQRLLRHLVDGLVDPDVDRRSDGTLMGLTIAQHVLRAHDGRITVENLPRSGSTFTLSFPAGRLAA